jgi:hypothetical protein
VRWLCCVAATMVALCGLPYLLAALFGPPELARMGTFWFDRDFSQYAAAMREGARQSSWLIHDHFSAEPQSAALMYPLYVATGKLAAFLGVSDLSVFGALEWLGRFAVLGALYAFAATFAKDRRQRRLAVVLALGTLGLDIWIIPLRLLLDAVGWQQVAALLPDSVNPYLEVNTFGVLLSAPHLMFGLALTLTCAPLYLRAIRGGWRWLALLGGAVLGLSLVHAFNTPVLVSVLVIHAVLNGRRAWPAALVAALAAAPMAIYSLVLYQTDPFWSGTYSLQNLMPAPPPWALPFNFGLVMLAAPLAWSAVRRWPRERRWLLLLWVAVGLVMTYAPVPYQRRFAFGVQPALAVLAGVGLLEFNAWLRAQRVGPLRRRLVNYTAALAAFSTSVLVYLSLMSSAVLNTPADVYVWTRAEADAGAWLADHSSVQDVVLASTDFANPLAGEIDGRVVQGHTVATLHNDQKLALVQRFYAADTTVEDRRAALVESQATIVAFGPHEQALGGQDLTVESDLDVMYARDGVTLYRVKR